MENCTEFAPIGRIFGERVPALRYSVIRDVYFLAYCNPIGPNPSKKPKTSTKREIILLARKVEFDQIVIFPVSRLKVIEKTQNIPKIAFYTR